MESKKEIYDFLPSGMYPKTILIKPGSGTDMIMRQLDEHELAFPLIAKPDIGMRGLRVSVLENEQALVDYVGISSVDFLLQEFVEYREEVGIFFCRLPDQQEGIVSGIVGKEFLSVTGDGTSTLGELILKNDRALLQWKELEKQYYESLSRIPAKNELQLLVPHGNHCRGAKFIDVSSQADDELTATINRICAQIPEFYYGRLDVKFNSWEELKRGEKFSIIELNGAGSEPAHIYDPSHSIFFAWKEIRHHLDLLYRISKMNKLQRGLNYMTLGEGIRMFVENRKHLALLSA